MIKEINWWQVVKLLFKPQNEPEAASNKSRICKYVEENNGLKVGIIVVFSFLLALLGFHFNEKWCSGMDFIGILLAATFFIMNLVYSVPLFNKNTRQEKRMIVSLATLYVIFQIFFAFLCYCFFSFQWKSYNNCMELFTILFILITDVDIFFHIFSLFISNNDN